MLIYKIMYNYNLQLFVLDANMESDHFMSAEEAVTFGLIDKVEQPSIN